MGACGNICAQKGQLSQEKDRIKLPDDQPLNAKQAKVEKKKDQTTQITDQKKTTLSDEQKSSLKNTEEALRLYQQKENEKKAKKIDMIKNYKDQKKVELMGKNYQKSAIQALVDNKNILGLEQLIITDNILSENLIQILAQGQWKNLKCLSLSSNKLKSLSKLISAKQWPLEELDLSSNEIGFDGFQSILESNWKGLKILNLNETKLKFSQNFKQGFNNLQNVVQLNLSENGVGDTLSKILVNDFCPNLSVLELKSNKINSSYLQNIKFMNKWSQSLTKIYLSNNQIEDDGVKILAESLKNLIYLDLESNKVTSKGALQIKSLKNLESLVLSFNQIKESDQDFNKIPDQWTGLKLNKIYLKSSNKQTQGLKDKLKEKFPKSQIII